MDESSRRCNNHDIIMHHEIYDLEMYQLATVNYWDKWTVLLVWDGNTSLFKTNKLSSQNKQGYWSSE